MNNVSLTFDVEFTCECGYKFYAREINTSSNEITVPVCPKCMEEKEREIETIEKDRDEQDARIHELEEENEQLKSAILRLSVNKSLGRETT